MTDRPLLAIILAAGHGTRMKSRRPKVLHEVARRPMVGHVLDAARAAGADEVAVVISASGDQVREAIATDDADTQVFVQAEQLGTAHAVDAAREAFAGFDGDVLVLYGDTPMIRPETLRRLREALSDGSALAVLGFDAADPTGYGRLLRDEEGALIGIREEKDASADERVIRQCNSGVMAFRAEALRELLPRIGNDNAKGEYYLTDAVALARGQGYDVAVAMGEEAEVLGVNDRAQLAAAEAKMQQRLRDAAMDGGATLIDPATVTFSYDTVLGPDVVVEPNVIFGPGVTVGDSARINGFSHIEGARVGPGASVGPFARLRPGAELGENVRIGNFVEIKKASIEDDAKVNHLTYIGDSRVGAGANIGAGTITCNYDGHEKHHTDIGAGAFIGSNSALVAPVKIGDRAYIGSGSVITRDVSAGSLALSRAPQEEREGWADRMHARRGRDKG
ncbi:bifunctional UDP-N-acetylglucosamine diphosphorylase/glucosamine-1-phosphate N-acetyltransferase GlmU [Dichotomicrobium thermohalophilum]|uniref:Bifunctional protein GlmU n=1 Tax=Dichotomicrobium thermohalophilum TaxID=933063 RepID=A0A397QDR4_9HYPH|nr:bifunctional UDP-N-acetylglucosamine diphosphorylase/glucosamine-1-phosphate N-acetyltransferase GlmU [Dichotomicrobium thermohalophilum]RIA56224.1 bifunctional UDP-N-acetylglucosamine pyrophosphorylase/glucosamine-1-phosphate N-acetyltransferase [Dichotomicrobium thermohalophilum]